MNCYQCHLMFNSRGRRVVFQCGYSFHQTCLRPLSQIIPQNCPIEGHRQCLPASAPQVESYINNILDKKVKVVFVGRKGVGKTSLIKSMNNMPSDRTRHTISIDFLSVTRTVGELRVQYSLWDTVSQSTIFQGFDSTFKNSDVQIIVERGQTVNETVDIFDYVSQNTQKPHIIIISNEMAGISNINIEAELAQLLNGQKYRYLKFNCMDHEEAKLLWEILDVDCIHLKENQSNLIGPVPSRLKIQSHVKKRSCLC